MATHPKPGDGPQGQILVGSQSFLAGTEILFAAADELKKNSDKWRAMSGWLTRRTLGARSALAGG